MASLDLFPLFEEGTTVAEFGDSILDLYENIITDAGISDQSTINMLAQLRAKTEIAFHEIIS